MPAISDLERLTALPLFRGLTTQQVAWLNERLHRKRFDPGSYIVTADQPGEALYIILEGTVKVEFIRANGVQVILGILGPGDTVGEMRLIDGSERSANVVALEAAVLLWMDRVTFRACLEAMPAIAYNLMRILSNRLRRANERIQALATLNIAGRLARQILTFAQEYGQVQPNGDIHIPLRLTQSDMADLIGASRVRVNQAMVRLKKQGYISVDADYHLILHDPEALVRRCGALDWSVSVFPLGAGIATSREATSTPEALLGLADTRLYEAKRRGRNQTVGPLEEVMKPKSRGEK